MNFTSIKKSLWWEKMTFKLIKRLREGVLWWPSGERSGLVTAVAWVQSSAWELLYAACAARKEKKERERERKRKKSKNHLSSYKKQRRRK